MKRTEVKAIVEARVESVLADTKEVAAEEVYTKALEEEGRTLPDWKSLPQWAKDVICDYVWQAREDESKKSVDVAYYT